jgi:flagellar motor switch protein FliG
VRQKLDEQKEKSYSFDELKEMSNAKVKQLLKEVDAESIAFALKDAGDDLRNKIIPNMTKSARKEYEHVRSEIKKVKKEDVLKSKDRIVAKMSKLFSRKNPKS